MAEKGYMDGWGGVVYGRVLGKGLLGGGCIVYNLPTVSTLLSGSFLKPYFSF